MHPSSIRRGRSCAHVVATGSGFEPGIHPHPAYRFPEEGDPLFVALSLEGGAVGLTSAAFPPIHGRVASTPAAGFELCVATDDVDAATSELRAAGVPLVVAPVDQPWGERIAYVTDPDDRLVLITGPARS